MTTIILHEIDKPSVIVTREQLARAKPLWQQRLSNILKDAKTTCYKRDIVTGDKIEPCYETKRETIVRYYKMMFCGETNHSVEWMETRISSRLQMEAIREVVEHDLRFAACVEDDAAMACR